MRQRNYPWLIGAVVFGAVLVAGTASAQNQRPERLAATVNIPPSQILPLLLRESEEVAIQALAKSSVTVEELNAYSVRNAYTLLHFAIYHNRMEFARALLERGVDPNRVSPYTTALHEATAYGNDHIANLLLEYGANVNAVDDNGDTPLTTAVRLNRTQLVHAFMERGARFDIENKWGETPLAFAARSDAVDVVHRALDSGVSPDIRIGGNERPLILWAAEGAAARTLEVLVAAGADLDVADKAGFQAIHEAAAAYGGHDSVRVLLSAGVNVESPHAHTAWRPLHFAAVSGAPDTIGALIEHHADVTARDAADRTALHIAVAAARADIIPVLIQHGASVSVSDIDGRSPLHWAALSGDVDSIRALSPTANDLALVGRDNRTALAYLKRNMDISAAEKNVLLKELSSSIPANPKLARMVAAVQSQSLRRVMITLTHSFDGDAAEESTGWTALHYAVAEGELPIVKVLMDRGLSPNVADNMGRTPMHISALLRHREILEFMYERGGDIFKKDLPGISAYEYIGMDASKRRPMSYFEYVPRIHLQTPAN